jgi:hypothetical protein
MSPGVTAILDRIEIRDRAGFVRERREELTIACVFQHPINIGMLVPILTASRSAGCERWIYLGIGIDGPTDRSHSTPSTCVCGSRPNGGVEKLYVIADVHGRGLA